jgi:hypothetical protein
LRGTFVQMSFRVDSRTFWLSSSAKADDSVRRDLSVNDRCPWSIGSPGQAGR